MKETVQVQRIEDRAAHIARDQGRMMRSLIELRKKHRLSQATVAERMGVSQPTVAGLERYDANPTLSTVLRYAVAVEARLATEVFDDCADAWEPDVVGVGSRSAS